jgi:putative ABC transport system permease protein
MHLALFAIRNIGRNRRRSATIVAMLALGTVAMLVGGGYVAATFHDLRELTIANGIGHLQIGGTGFLRQDQETRPLASGLADASAVRRVVDADPRVRATLPRIDFSGLISNGDKSLIFVGQGVDPAAEYGPAGFRLSVRSGRGLASTGQAEVVLGVGLAEAMQARLGDRLTVLGQTVDGAINGADVIVVGTYSTGIKAFDDRALVVRLDTAQQVLQTGAISKLVVVLDDTAHTLDAQADLQRALHAAGQRTEIATWSAFAPFYHQVRSLFSGIFAFLGTIIVVLVVLSTSNAMTMAVMERVREIGTLMALGTPRRLVLFMFLVEGLGLGALGTGLGAIAGALLARVLTQAHILLPPPPTFSEPVLLNILLVPPLLIGAPLVLVATLTLASVAPAARAARLRITDALGHI